MKQDFLSSKQVIKILVFIKKTFNAFFSGEITFKLHAKWDENLLNENSATFKILEGNVRKAVRMNTLMYCKDDIEFVKSIVDFST